MTSYDEDIRQLAKEFESCRKVMLALGDENRQHLILEMMQMGSCGGVRVGVIADRSHLSRPAVSHHIQILKDAGILRLRKEGTKNYYYFDVGMESMSKLIIMLQHAENIMKKLPCRSEEKMIEVSEP